MRLLSDTLRGYPSSGMPDFPVAMPPSTDLVMTKEKAVKAAVAKEKKAAKKKKEEASSKEASPPQKKASPTEGALIKVEDSTASQGSPSVSKVKYFSNGATWQVNRRCRVHLAGQQKSRGAWKRMRR